MTRAVNIPASARLQRETSREAQYLYSSLMFGFHYPLAKCQVLILSWPFSLRTDS